MTVSRKPLITDLGLTPQMSETITAFEAAVVGPYAVQIDGMLNKDGYWTEVEIVFSRDREGVKSYDVFPKANPKSVPVGRLKKAGTGQPAGPAGPDIPGASGDRRSAYSHQQFGGYKADEVAGTLMAHDAKGGGTLVVEGGYGYGYDDEVADDLGNLPEVTGKPKRARSSGAAKPKRKSATTKKAVPKAASARKTAKRKPAKRRVSARKSPAPPGSKDI